MGHKKRTEFLHDVVAQSFVIFNCLYLHPLHHLNYQQMELLQVLVQLFQAAVPVIHLRYSHLFGFIKKQP